MKKYFLSGLLAFFIVSIPIAFLLGQLYGNLESLEKDPSVVDKIKSPKTDATSEISRTDESSDLETAKAEEENSELEISTSYEISWDDPEANDVVKFKDDLIYIDGIPLTNIPSKPTQHFSTFVVPSAYEGTDFVTSYVLETEDGLIVLGKYKGSWWWFYPQQDLGITITVKDATY